MNAVKCTYREAIHSRCVNTYAYCGGGYMDTNNIHPGDLILSSVTTTPSIHRRILIREARILPAQNRQKNNQRRDYLEVGRGVPHPDPGSDAYYINFTDMPFTYREAS